MLYKNRLANPLYLDLRTFDSPEDYFKQCDVDVRTSFRKCNKHSYEIKQLTDITAKDSSELYNIWTSSPTRQGRPINMNYEDLNFKLRPITAGKWPIEKYSAPLVFYALYIDNIIVGYLELLFEKDYAIVHSTLGHSDYLKYGIMKTLFFEVIKLNWNNINKLIYGRFDSTTHFKDDLRINKIWK